MIRPYKPLRDNTLAGMLPPVALADSVKKARLALGWSQYRLAKEAHLSPTQVKEIEDRKNRNPGVLTARKLAAALETGLDALLDGEVSYSTEQVERLAVAERSSSSGADVDAVTDEVWRRVLGRLAEKKLLPRDSPPKKKTRPAGSQ